MSIYHHYRLYQPLIFILGRPIEERFCYTSVRNKQDIICIECIIVLYITEYSADSSVSWLILLKMSQYISLCIILLLLVSVLVHLLISICVNKLSD